MSITKNTLIFCLGIVLIPIERAFAQEDFSGPLNVTVDNDIVGALNVGSDNLNNSNFTFTFGKQVETSAWGAVSMGYLSKVSGQVSLAQGYSAEASGYSSFSMGTFTKAMHDYSQAFGKSTTASGQVSTAFGEGTKSEAQYSFAIGRWNVGGGSPATWVDTDPLFEIGIGTNNSNRINAITVLKNGKTGIGTTTPTEKLSVNGSIRSKEVKVEAAPWPDYVFATEYALPTLSETESYIQKNHRLPNMPSAEEVAENGIALGEMNRLLVEKVEELTLYMIERENEYKELLQLVRNQNEKINVLESKIK